jgi:hypothetical protein
VVVVRHYELLVVGVERDAVIRAAGEVIDFPGNGIRTVVGIELIAGIVVSAALCVNWIRQCTVLSVNGLAGSHKQSGDIACNNAPVSINDINLPQGVPVKCAISWRVILKLRRWYRWVILAGF